MAEPMTPQGLDEIRRGLMHKDDVPDLLAEVGRLTVELAAYEHPTPALRERTFQELRQLRADLARARQRNEAAVDEVRAANRRLWDDGDVRAVSAYLSHAVRALTGDGQDTP